MQSACSKCSGGSVGPRVGLASSDGHAGEGMNLGEQVRDNQTIRQKEEKRMRRILSVLGVIGALLLGGMLVGGCKGKTEEAAAPAAPTAPGVATPAKPLAAPAEKPAAPAEKPAAPAEKK